MTPKVEMANESETKLYDADLPNVTFEELTAEQRRFAEENPHLFFDPALGDDGIDYEQIMDDFEAERRGERPPAIRIESLEHLHQLVMEAGRQREEASRRDRAH